jgi:hypothetical protein
MDIGGRGGAGCGIEERVILPDSGRGMREGIGKEIVDFMRIGGLAVNQIRRSLVYDIGSLIM